MRATLQTACAVSMALAGLVACRSRNGGANSYTSNGAVGGAPAETTITPAQANGAAAAPTTTTGNASQTAAGTVDLGTLGDTAILAKADAGDSAEVAIAEYMRANSRNPAVKAYAVELAHDHSTGITHVRTTAHTMHMPMKLPSTDTTAQETQHTLDHLKSLSGNDRDTAFVNHEIQDHQSDIAETQSMLNAAKDAQVRDLLNQELPELRKHLSDAQKLQSNLSNSTSQNR